MGLLSLSEKHKKDLAFLKRIDGESNDLIFYFFIKKK